MTERSDIHKYSIVNRQSSIPALPGWVIGHWNLGFICNLVLVFWDFNS
jgi:hypothetical protein